MSGAGENTRSVQADQARNRLLGDLITSLNALTAATTALPGQYQSNTWTPTLLGSSTAGGPTYSTQVGSYEKVGRQVTARFAITISAIGGMTGNLEIGGLPFTSTTVTNDIGTIALASFSGLTFSASYGQLAGDIPTNSNIARLIQTGSGQTALALPISGVASATTLVGVLHYRINGT